jgi:hypothetical protein
MDELFKRSECKNIKILFVNKMNLASELNLYFEFNLVMDQSDNILSRLPMLIY